MTNTTAQTLIDAPRELRTARTVLKAPHTAQVPVRMAWAAANHDALHFLPGWRRSMHAAVAERSAQSEVDSFNAGTELIFNVFELPPSLGRGGQENKRAESEPYACGPYVGRIDLHSWDFDAPRCELGYMADVRTHRRGLLREAAAAALELAFALGAARVQAITDTQNHSSIRFAQALGFEPEGVLRAYERNSEGQLCDQLLLSILAPRLV